MGRIILFSVFLFYALLAQANQDQRNEDVFSEVRAMYRVDLDSAFNLSLRALKLGKDNNDTYTIVLSNYYLGYISDDERKKPLVGLIYYLDAIKRFELYPNKESENLFINICQNAGITYKSFSQDEIARQFFFKALRIAYQNGDFSKSSKLLRLITDTYKEYSNKDVFYMYADSAISLAKKGDRSFYLEALNSIGVSAIEMGDYLNAKKYFERQLAETTDHNYDPKEYKYFDFAIHNLGNCYFKMKDYPSAKANLIKARLLKDKQPDLFASYNFFNSYFDLGQVYYQVNQFDSANYCFRKALTFASEFNLGGDKSKFQIHQLYSKSLIKLENIDLALEQQAIYESYMENYLTLKEQIAIENQKLNIDLITKRYFSEVDSPSEMKSSVQWIAVASGLIILALISIISAMMYRSKQLKNNIESELKSIMSSTPDSN